MAEVPRGSGRRPPRQDRLIPLDVGDVVGGSPAGEIQMREGEVAEQESCVTPGSKNSLQLEAIGNLSTVDDTVNGNADISLHRVNHQAAQLERRRPPGK